MNGAEGGLAWSRLLQELDALACAPSLAELEIAAEAIVRALHGRLLALAKVAIRNPPATMSFVAGVFPEHWRERYEALGFGQADPVWQVLSQAPRPVALETALQGGAPDDAAVRHYQEQATGFGIAHPLGRALDGDVPVVVFAGAAQVTGPELEVQRRLTARTFGDEALRRLQTAPGPTLTPQQRACLAAAARGRNSLQIAGDLGLAAKTVDIYIAAAGRRLGARNRLGAVSTALRLGLI